MERLLKNSSLQEFNMRFSITTAYILAFLAHAAYMLLFFRLDVYQLAYFNIFSPLLYLGCIYLAVKGYVILSAYIASMEVLVHSVLATVFIGWNSGFHLFIILLYLLIFLIPGERLYFKIIITSILTILYVSLFFFHLKQSAYHSLSTSTLNILYVINIVTLAIVVSVFAYVYSRTVVNSQEMLQKKEAKLLQLNSSKDKFFTLIAHDLKSPFNSLKGLTELMVERFETMPDDRKLLMLKELSTLTADTYKLLSDLLEWSRSQLDEAKVVPLEVDVQKSFKELIVFYKRQLQNKEIKLETLIPEDTKIFADKNMAETVFRNLLSNAIKFTRKGGHIQIKASQDGGNIKIEIADNGIGMTQDQIDKLFTIEFKPKSEGTAKEKGTGLGLILCKEFSEKNGGRIEVQSIPDDGSVFSVYFPVA